MASPLISTNYVTLTPAYGRDYTSAAKAKADFLQGKDFRIRSIQYTDGTYCSIRDFAPGTHVTLRYRKLTQVTVVVVPNG